MRYPTLTLAIVAVLAAGPAVAGGVPYGQCREIVAQHAFMLEARKGCDAIQLREDTSELAYSCAPRLSAQHRALATSIGEATAAKYRAENGTKTCSKLKDDFYPLIRN